MYSFLGTQITLKQTKDWLLPQASCNIFDKMDSPESWDTSVVKIEIDIAEEPPVPWGIDGDDQGQGQ